MRLSSRLAASRSRAPSVPSIFKRERQRSVSFALFNTRSTLLSPPQSSPSQHSFPPTPTFTFSTCYPPPRGIAVPMPQHTLFVRRCRRVEPTAIRLRHTFSFASRGAIAVHLARSRTNSASTTCICSASWPAAAGSRITRIQPRGMVLPCPASLLAYSPM